MASNIAVVGMAVDLPGAHNIDEFWAMTCRQATTTKVFPERRKRDIVNYVQYARNAAVKPLLDTSLKFHNGSYLDRIDLFDYGFFKITPRQGALADPVQRLLLKTSYHALEDAGFSGARSKALRVGVYVGYSVNPGQTYVDYLTRTDPSLTPLCLTGNMGTMLANRISFELDLHGPSLVVNSACSATLVAIHEAKNALLLGDCDVAIVAGARIILAPLKSSERALGIESSDGNTRTFDEQADGTGFGEGAGAIVLTRLDDALARGDQIYAVIAGSAVNHDGRSEMITAPDSKSQTALLLDAWSNSGVNPRDIGYIEVHGTATRIGDPIEFNGLKHAFAQHTADKMFCAVGTAKTNVGHLFEASGVIGFIKAALVLNRATIPALANFTQPNRRIDFSEGPIRIPTVNETWQSGPGPRYAGVSAFGIGGTNCHIVLGTAPEPSDPISVPASQLFVLSANSERSLRMLVQAYARHLTQVETPSLADICYTSLVSRSHHALRLALRVASISELGEALAALGDGRTPATEFVSSIPGWGVTSSDPVLLAYVGGVSLPELPHGRIVALPPYPYDEERCWQEFPVNWGDLVGGRLNLPGNQVHPSTHDIVFRSEPLGSENSKTRGVLVLIDPDTRAEQRLAVAQRPNVTVLKLGDHGSPDRGGFDVTAEGMQRVAAHVVEHDYSHIVHALALEIEPSTSVQEVDRRIRKNLESLFLLSQALMRAGVRAKLSVLTQNACALHDGAMVIAPENSSLAGLAKVIGREFPYLKTRVEDVDATASPDLVWRELMRDEPGLHLLRDGVSYREEFEELLEIECDRPGAYLKAGGTYLITGGTGGIGLAIIEDFVRQQPDINLVLLSRSGVPPRKEWDSIDEDVHGWRAARTVSVLRDAERSGARVYGFAVDVGDPEALAAVLAQIAGSVGTIDGVVHAAGIPGRNMISLRSLADFRAVVAPKILGANIIESACGTKAPDFVVYFSSVAVVFPASGQGDYAAANYYFDTLARAARADDTHVVSIDWVAWRDTGMAVDGGTWMDTTFKALPTEAAIKILDRALRSKRRRVFAGEVNYDGNLVHIFKSFDVRLSDGVAKKMSDAEESLQERLRAAAQAKRQEIEAVELKLEGGIDGRYRDAEVVVARCFAHALGYDAIDVTGDFFSIGGDSLMATSVASSIAMCLGVEFDVADLLMQRTVVAIVDSLEAFGELR
ncbi:SDR family NAD(P)-dependent oxidoreductase [Trinickia sp. NRRL B-1857]|uniref:SDR family NAD(P)-dependent oxidoreductase n=1 Tax=Trinickia sp. NRRL B-1857 TaxID=3162879 RepID=UPI003D290983